MKKSLILKRLWATIEKLVNLDPEQFSYSELVSEGNTEKVCGTVCCVAGWYPKWFPKAELIWDLSYSSAGFIQGIDLYPVNNNISTNVSNKLSEYHGLNDDIIDFLFYGFITNLQLTEKGLLVADQIEEYWKKDVYVYPDYSEDGVKYFQVEMARSTYSTLPEVIMGFRFMHYLIENDYIEDYSIKSFKKVATTIV